MVVVHDGWDSAIGVNLCEPARCADGERMLKQWKLRAVAPEPVRCGSELGTAQKAVDVA